MGDLKWPIYDDGFFIPFRTADEGLSIIKMSRDEKKQVCYGPIIFIRVLASMDPGISRPSGRMEEGVLEMPSLSARDMVSSTAVVSQLGLGKGL